MRSPANLGNCPNFGGDRQTKKKIDSGTSETETDHFFAQTTKKGVFRTFRGFAPAFSLLKNFKPCYHCNQIPFFAEQ